MLATLQEADPPSVLVVEDSITDQHLMRLFLERLGCRCTFAPDGRQAVKAAEEGCYDFVFMDLEMPVLDGLEATKRIHDAMGPASPFIVALTAHDSEADRRRAADAGIDYFLSKPVRMPVLRGLLADI